MPSVRVLYVGALLLTQCIFIVLRVFSSGYRLAHIVRVQMLVTLEFAMFLGSCLVWRRLTAISRPPTPGATFPLFSYPRNCLCVLLLLAHGSFAFFYVTLGSDPSWLAALSFWSFGIHLHLMMLMVGCVAVELVGGRLLSAGLWATRPRLRALVTSEALHTRVAVCVALGLTLLGATVVSRAPTVRQHTVYISGLPAAIDGLRIVLLTDLHIGPTVGRRRVARAVRLANQLEPDVVAIAGDIADGSVDHLLQAAEPLRGLIAKYGKYFCTGNHDYYHGNADDWMRQLELLGVHSLHNSNKKIFIGAGRSVCIAGVDDLWADRLRIANHGLDAEAALDGCAETDTVILLAHQPNAAKRVLDSDVGARVDLVLSGHTHGGQLYIAMPMAYVVNAYFLGLYRHASGAQVYVSAGVNYWGPPLKMPGLSEISLLVLRPSPQ